VDTGTRRLVEGMRHPPHTACPPHPQHLRLPTCQGTVCSPLRAEAGALRPGRVYVITSVGRYMIGGYVRR
jgi:hypothetical protein